MNSEREYRGKVALITGAARGIGLCIARRLAEEGAHVIIADVNWAKGSEASQELRNLGFLADFIHADLSVAGGGATMIDAALNSVERIDVLVNNARAGRRCSLLEETEDNWELSLTVGLKAAFFAAQSTIRLMASRGGCSIVNVASVAGVQVTQESPSYHASKSGLLHLTKYLAVAGGPYHARVNCVLPGFIVQDEHRARYEAEGNDAYRALAASYQPLASGVGTERDVAEAVLYLCSARARYVSGACLVLDGAATAQEPFGLLQKISSNSRA